VTASVETSALAKEISPLSWAPLAAVVGPLWATLGLFNGVTATQYAALAGGGALSVWLVLIALSELRRNQALLHALLGASAVASIILSVLGEALWQRTHHRPLGAVTFAVLAIATVLLTLLAFRGRRLPLSLSATFACVALAAVSYFAASGAPLTILESAVGVLLSTLAFSYGQRLLPQVAAVRTPASILVLLGAAIAVGLSPESGKHALILGLPGLLH
jgi:hypothetical protein